MGFTDLEDSRLIDLADLQDGIDHRAAVDLQDSSGLYKRTRIRTTLLPVRSLRLGLVQ